MKKLRRSSCHAKHPPQPASQPAGRPARPAFCLWRCRAPSRGVPAASRSLLAGTKGAANSGALPPARGIRLLVWGGGRCWWFFSLLWGFSCNSVLQSLLRRTKSSSRQRRRQLPSPRGGLTFQAEHPAAPSHAEARPGPAPRGARDPRRPAPGPRPLPRAPAAQSIGRRLPPQRGRLPAAHLPSPRSALTKRAAGPLRAAPAAPGPKAAVGAPRAAFCTAAHSADGRPWVSAPEMHRFGPTQPFVMNY